MKTLAIYFTAPGFDEYPFDTEDYRDAYYKLGQMFAERNVRCVIVRGDSYQGGQRFSGGWIYRNGEFVRTEGDIDADLIFNKGRRRFDADANVINNPHLEELCTNKLKTYERFGDYSPRTILVASRENLAQAALDIPGRILVAKPLDGEGGNGVIVGPRDEILRTIRSFPYLLQEFIDTSRGIPNITKGKHDLRIISIQGDIISAFVRLPGEGSYLSNVSQGGVIEEVALALIPASARQVFEQIDGVLSRYETRLYSLDLGLHSDGTWKIIELNTQPGLAISDHNGTDSGKRFFERVVDFLVAHA